MYCFKGDMIYIIHIIKKKVIFRSNYGIKYTEKINSLNENNNLVDEIFFVLFKGT